MTLVVGLLFGSLVLLPAFLQGFISTSGWTLFLTLRLTRDCIFFPGKEHAANSRSASSSLVRMDCFNEATPFESEQIVKLPSFFASVCLRFGKAQQN